MRSKVNWIKEKELCNSTKKCDSALTKETLCQLFFIIAAAAKAKADYKEKYGDEDFDIFMIYPDDDLDDALTLREVLQKFVILEGNRMPAICLEPMDIPHVADKLDYLTIALQRSSYKFLFLSNFFSKDKDGWLKFQQHQALWSMIKKKDQSIVPVKEHRDMELPEFLDMYRALDISRLLRGRTLKDCNNCVELMSKKQLDCNLLRNIEKMLNYANAQVGMRVGMYENVHIRRNGWSILFMVIVSTIL